MHHTRYLYCISITSVLCFQAWLTSWQNWGIAVFEPLDLQKFDCLMSAYNKEICLASEEQREKAAKLLHDGERLLQQGYHSLALESYEEALRIYRKIHDRFGEAQSLQSIGEVHQQQGDFEQALSIYQRSLDLARDIRAAAIEWHLLNSIGSIYADLGRYVEALEVHERALEIVKTLNRPLDEQAVLTDFGIVYTYLGEYERALEIYQQASEVNQRVQSNSDADKFKQHRNQAVILYNAGWAYIYLKRYLEAINNYQQVLSIVQEIGDLEGEAHTLNNLGYTYYIQGQPDRALPLLQQAVVKFKELNDRDGLARTFDSLGNTYTGLRQFEQAWKAYQQSLTLAIEIKSFPHQRLTLSNIGDLLLQQNQPELAIIFYKRSVNVTESIRRNIQGLPVEQQQSYANTVADTYRKLADLLLQQDRVLEAQQVLDLLKVQEVQDYLRRGVRGSEQTAQGIDLLPQERRVSDQFDADLNQAIALGRELTELEAIPAETLTSQQQQRILELREIQRQTQVAFLDFLAQPEVKTAIETLRQTTEAQNIEPAYLNVLRRNLQQLQQDAVLLYPLILEDRLELVLLSPDAPPIHRSVPVGRVALNQSISNFLTALKDPNSNAKVPAQQLYDWLIRPIEADLKQANAKTILYAPDGQLRYIPLAALYDGRHWLVEQYRINHITALSLYNLTALPRTQTRVLAGAFAEGRFNISRGEYRYPFSGLPFARTEVATLAQLFPGTTELVDRAFNRAATMPHLNDYTIVHLATHALFVTGQPEDSFIVLGDGDLITLREVSELSLTNVDLMVLSACQTAVSTLGDGKEILGFGYQIQQAGARAALASLWAVDDGGTQVLMSRFYELLRQGNLTKTAALQQAQIALVQKHPLPALPLTTHQGIPTDRSYLTPDALAHPYYWAPFILIGNGL